MGGYKVVKTSGDRSATTNDTACWKDWSVRIWNRRSKIIQEAMDSPYKEQCKACMREEYYWKVEAWRVYWRKRKDVTVDCLCVSKEETIYVHRFSLYRHRYPLKRKLLLVVSRGSRCCEVLPFRRGKIRHLGVATVLVSTPVITVAIAVATTDF